MPLKNFSRARHLPLDLGQPAEARGQLAGEPVVVDLELLERLGLGNFRGDRAGELVVREVELAQLREAGAKAARERPLEPGTVDVEFSEARKRAKLGERDGPAERRVCEEEVQQVVSPSL